MTNFCLGLFKKAFPIVFARLCIAQSGVTDSYLTYNAANDQFETVVDSNNSTGGTIPHIFSGNNLISNYPRILNDYMFPVLKDSFNFSDLGFTNQFSRYPLKKDRIGSSFQYTFSNIFLLNRGSGYTDNPYSIIGPQPYLYDIANKDNQKVLAITLDGNAHFNNITPPIILELWEADIDLDSQSTLSGINCYFSKVAGSDYSTAALGLPANITQFRILNGVFNEDASAFSVMIMTVQDFSGTDVVSTTLADGIIYHDGTDLRLALTAMTPAVAINTDYEAFTSTITGNSFVNSDNDIEWTVINYDPCDLSVAYFSGARTMSDSRGSSLSAPTWTYSRECEVDYDGATKKLATQNFIANYSMNKSATSSGTGTIESTTQDNSNYMSTSSSSGTETKDTIQEVTGTLKLNDVDICDNFYLYYHFDANLTLSCTYPGSDVHGGQTVETFTLNSVHMLYSDLRHEFYVIERSEISFVANQPAAGSKTGSVNFTTKLAVIFKGIETTLHTADYGNIDYNNFIDHHLGSGTPVVYISTICNNTYPQPSVSGLPVTGSQACPYPAPPIVDTHGPNYTDEVIDIHTLDPYSEAVNIGVFPIDDLRRLIDPFFPSLGETELQYKAEWLLNPGPDAVYDTEAQLINPFESVNEAQNRTSYDIRSAACDGNNYIVYLRQEQYSTFNTDGTVASTVPNTEKVILNGEYLDPTSNTKNIPSTASASTTFVI